MARPVTFLENRSWDGLSNGPFVFTSFLPKYNSWEFSFVRQRLFQFVLSFH